MAKIKAKTKKKKKSNGSGSYQGGLTNLMKEAQKMQYKIEKIKNELKLEEYYGESGDSENIVIKATINGDLELKDLEISDEAYKEDKEMLSDLIITAINKAIKESQSKKDEQMSGVTSGLSFPGLF